MKFSLTCQKKVLSVRDLMIPAENNFCKFQFFAGHSSGHFNTMTEKVQQVWLFSFLNVTNMRRGNGPLFCALRHLEIHFILKPMKQQKDLASINHHLHVCTFQIQSALFFISQKKNFCRRRLLSITCLSFSVANTDQRIDKQVWPI